MDDLNYNNQCKTFARFGFVEPALSELEFITVIKSGLHEYAYEIGCDLFSGAFDSIDQAIAYYKEKKNT